MKGILFYNHDGGRGGPDGFLEHCQKWCVELEGRKMHIASELTGSVGFPPDNGGPQRDVRVSPCDGSCAKLVEVGEETMRKALPLIEFVDWAITPQEKADLPEELEQSSFVSELLKAYQGMREELVKERKKARAGFDLYRSVIHHLLSWFFRAELKEYETSIGW